MGEAITEAVQDVVTSTLKPAFEEVVTELTPGQEIVKELEAAIVDRLTEVFIMYKPWIMGVAISSSIFICFIFIALLLVLIVLMCQGGGNINMTLRSMVNKDKYNYSLLSASRDEEEDVV